MKKALIIKTEGNKDFNFMIEIFKGKEMIAIVRGFNYKIEEIRYDDEAYFQITIDNKHSVWVDTYTIM